MKKITLFIASLFITLGAMAQTVVTSINTAKEYTIENMRGSYIGVMQDTSGKTLINGRSEEGTKFVFETVADVENGYYIKHVDTQKYLYSPDGSKVNASIENKTIFIFKFEKAISDGDPSGRKNAVSFKLQDEYKYLNDNASKSDGTTTNLQMMTHNGGVATSNLFSLWRLREYSSDNTGTETPEPENPEPENPETPEYSLIDISKKYYLSTEYYVTTTADKSTAYLKLVPGRNKSDAIITDNIAEACVFTFENAATEGAYKLSTQINEEKYYIGKYNGSQTWWVDANNNALELKFISETDGDVYTISNEYGLFKCEPTNEMQVFTNGSETEAYEWSLVEVKEETSYTLNVTDAGYATMYLGRNVQIPTGCEVYIVESANNNSVQLKHVTGVLPAETGVIVKADAGDYTFNYTEETAENFNKGLLKGSLSDELISEDAYVLSNVPGEVGLYKAIKNYDATGNKHDDEQVMGSFKNFANKAYLLASDITSIASLSNNLRFEYAGATAIDEVEAENENAAVIYDLQGRRVNEITEAGIYIINGNKVLIK